MVLVGAAPARATSSPGTTPSHRAASTPPARTTFARRSPARRTPRRPIARCRARRRRRASVRRRSACCTSSRQNGIAVDRISGCSVGGVVAALYASGMNAGRRRRRVLRGVRPPQPVPRLTLPRVALSAGHRAEAALDRQFGDLHFEELPRQLALVSTDMLEHAPSSTAEGSCGGLRASFSLPGLFPPAGLNGSLHIDGGVLDNLPVSALEEDEGPIVAVNIAAGAGFSRRAGPPRMPTLPETMLRTMLMGSARELAAAREHATVVVTPDTRGIGLLEFHQIDRAVEAGRAAGRAALDALASLSR